jgi:membrane protease YdiL (CAAX protease family)
MTGNTFFKRHKGRGSYDLFSTYAHYLPDTKGMFLLFLFFLSGALLGNLLVLALNLVSQEFASIYGTVISYPVMFIPPLLYASAQSRRNEYFDKGYALDSSHFGKLGGIMISLIVSVATLALAFITDSLTKILPEAPQWFEDAMDAIMDAPTWLTLISVSVFAPLFEEWLCRGLVLRGLLQTKSPAAAIAISAAFFAILHMNPWQAVPAFILGLLFGYVYYKTGSLKLTMLMHCVNNSFAVIFSKIPEFAEADSLMDVMHPITYACIFLACAAFLWGATVTLRSIPMIKEDAKSNCDEVDAISI